jgi:hypothetical protein
MSLGVTLRYAFPDDTPALLRLAALDSHAALNGPVLLAEIDGELLAAIAVESGVAIADPFQPTADLVELLRRRVAQLSVEPAPVPRGFARLRARLAWL